MNRSAIFFFTCLWLHCAFVFSTTVFAQNHLDSINLGDESSERDHQLDADRSEAFKGAVDSPARRLLPPKKENWFGGNMVFKMKVDPKEQNYFTAKFWGGEQTGDESRLMLFLEGMQIGQRHLGEVDPLDIQASSLRYPDRFFYKTVPLPIHLTNGKKEVTLSIRVEGGIHGYSPTFEGFQHMLEKPSRGIYRCYTHTESFLTVDKNEEQGQTPSSYPVRPTPGPEVLDAAMERVNKHLTNLIAEKKHDMSDSNVAILTRACFVPWTVAYHNRDALNKIVRALDYWYLKYTEDNEIFQAEWHGAGPLGGSISLLGEKSLSRYLDLEIEGTGVLRRDAWTTMLIASRDWHISHRRSYSNQAMTVDYNLYMCNRGIAVLNPRKAWPERQGLGILHEGAGIKPWRGSYLEKDGRADWPWGKKFKQTTDMGLSRELGYVGAYGELVVPIIRDMYEASRPRRGAEGDPKLKAQVIKVAKARSAFRYPLTDNDGFRAMRMETIIGWRDWHYPGEIAYAQWPCDDGGPGDAAATTMDPDLLGYCQQMMDDNQYFAAIDSEVNRRSRNVFKALLRMPENYEKIKNYRGKKKRLPMTPGEPDFVFADTDVGAVALKHGDEILFASLYWRARYGVNNLARVHFLSPLMERDATVAINTGFDDSGMSHKVRNRTNLPFKDRFEKEYQKHGPKLAMTDVIYPIAAIPSFIKDFKPGKENLYAGKGTQYLMTYGQYCIAMNCQSKRITFDIPPDFIGAKVLAGKTKTEVRAKYRLQGYETLVLYKEK